MKKVLFATFPSSGFVNASIRNCLRYAGLSKSVTKGDDEDDYLRLVKCIEKHCNTTFLEFYKGIFEACDNDITTY